MVAALAMNGQPASGQSTEEQGDIFPRTDHVCDEGGSSTYVFFDEGQSEATAAQAASPVENTSKSWKADGGFVLVESHIDGQEASASRGDLAAERAAFIKDLLVKAGINVRAIYSRLPGNSEPRTKQLANTSNGEDRRVRITLSSAGRSCRRGFVSRQVDWMLQNCFQKTADIPEMCLRTLKGFSRYVR
jgi:outer membrane protein OmpA-like peptidoglycan-associated protein